MSISEKSTVIFLLPVNTQAIVGGKIANVWLDHLTPITPGMPLHFLWRTNGSVTPGKGSLTSSGGCHCGLLEQAAKWSSFFLSLLVFCFFFVHVATLDLVNDLARMYSSEVQQHCSISGGPVKMDASDGMPTVTQQEVRILLSRRCLKNVLNYVFRVEYQINERYRLSQAEKGIIIVLTMMLELMLIIYSFFFF